MGKRVEIVFDGKILDYSSPEDRAKMAELGAAVVRLRNFGGTMSTIADKLHISEEVAEVLLANQVREIMADDVQTVAARQQAMMNDIRKAMYPGMEAGDDKHAGILMRVADHEAKMHGLLAPTRVRIGLDQEAFVSTVDEDIRALGVHPQGDIPLDEDDEPWANT